MNCRLVQALKESPTRHAHVYQGLSKITMAHDAIQAIKQLRRDVVEAMRSLMKLAKEKQTSGMLPICEDMISKTRILLSLWDPGLVEEALTFLEEHKVAKIPEDDTDEIVADDDEAAAARNKDLSLRSVSLRSNQTLSPFKRITQQLHFDLKSSDFDDFISPDTPDCVQDLWTEEAAKNKYMKISCSHEINSNRQIDRHDNFVIFPDVDDDGEAKIVQDTASESHCGNESNSETNNNHSSETTECRTDGNEEAEEDEEDDDAPEEVDLGKRFLDTQKMCNSPSANYYKPTDEPEPWDLTQLNIEASVMCLVSKVKFLCGRCSSPAVRLRNKNANIARTQSLKGYTSNNRNGITCSSGAVVTIQPKNGFKSEESSMLLKNNGNNGTPRQQQRQSSPANGADKETPGFAKAKDGMYKSKLCFLRISSV